jgi:hypothetical protein
VTQTEIPLPEIEYHPLSFCDTSGSRLFRWGGELYRGITADHAGFYRSLFERGVVSRLVEQGLLVETELTELAVGDFTLVLRHRTIPVVSYPFEWSSAMLRDAGLLVSDLALELGALELGFTDASGWNVLFDGARPVFVDFTSIEEQLWPGWEGEYQRSLRVHFLEPLELIARGYGRVARAVLADYDGDGANEVAELLGFASPTLGWRAELLAPGRLQRARARARLLRRRSDPGPKELRRELEEAPVGAAPAPPPAPEAPGRVREVEQVLRQLEPASVLDLGCGEGAYSRLAARLGSEVVAIDADDALVGACYRRAAAERLRILPLVMNVRNPSPSYGACASAMRSAFDRLGCELVLALGLLDELVHEHYLEIDQVAETLARFSRRWLLVEFVPPPERRAWKARPTVPGYSLEHVEAALARWFTGIQTLSAERDGSALLLCEK